MANDWEKLTSGNQDVLVYSFLGAGLFFSSFLLIIIAGSKITVFLEKGGKRE